MKVARKHPDYLKIYYQNNRDKIIEMNLKSYYLRDKQVVHCAVCNKDCKFYKVHCKTKKHLEKIYEIV